MSKLNKKPTECKVCSDDAFNTYYGVKTCEPCKVFFKRNAENRKKIFKCDFDDQCQINFYNRHICSACRLKKCFTVGMCSGMIRAPQVTKRKKQSRSIIKDLSALQLTPLSLFDRDISLLNPDQWVLLSNVIHSYDKFDALSVTRGHLKELDSLHPKLRFKIDSSKIMNMVSIIYETTELFLSSNKDISSLPSNHRSIVLPGAYDNVSCLNGTFVLRDSGLIYNPAFQQGLQNTFGITPYNLTMNVISLLGEDPILIKLSLGLFAFCTPHCTLFDRNQSVIYIQDYRILLKLQNIYAELIWKYLIYKYSFKDAVRRFSHLLQCFIYQLTIRTYLQTNRNHTKALDSLVQKIDQQHQMDILQN